MKINLKAGLLIILLAAPAFLFLFLFFFGENQFDLPYLLAIGTKEKKEITILEKCKNFSNPEFIFENSDKTELISDSVYLTFKNSYDNNTRSVKILYDCLAENGPSENQIAELKRIEGKIQNQDKVKMLLLYREGKDQAYFTEFYELLELCFKQYYFPDGMLILIDENNYFRGFYDPSIKSEVDRLITEYQILLDK